MVLLSTLQAALFPQIIFQCEHDDFCGFQIKSMKEALSAEGPSKGSLSSLDVFKKQNNLWDVFLIYHLPGFFREALAAFLTGPGAAVIPPGIFLHSLGPFFFPSQYHTIFLARFCLLSVKRFLPSQIADPSCSPICIAGNCFLHWGFSEMLQLALITFSFAFLMVSQADFFTCQCLPFQIRAVLRYLL